MRTSSQTLCSVLLVAQLLCVLYLQMVWADLPVHCEFEQVKGTWKIYLTKQEYSYDATSSICSLRSKIPSENIEKVLTLDFQGPNIVKTIASTNSNDQLEDGTWTLIYDQGFDFRLQGKTHFAFFNYSESSGKVISHCGETFTGWFRNVGLGANHFGCFYGQKVKEEEHQSDQGMIMGLSHNEYVPPSAEKILGSKAPLKFKNDRSMISLINKVQKSWIAASYPKFEAMTNEHVLKMQGHPMAAFRAHHRIQHKKYMQKNYPQNLKMDANIPESFDWRNVDGVNYVSPVRNQGHCGSCYSFASAGMYEARVRVASKNQFKPVFSTQDVVDCNPYSQGCDGGFAYLVSRYGEEIGIALEECNPYHANDTQCAPREKCYFARQKVTDISYIGGYYGAATEQLMMQDIYDNGPMAVSMMVYSDFKYYKGGVYHHVTITENSESGPDPRFVITNHVVVIVGWGVTPNGEKFWIVKNSWGEEWGESGFFRIVRGTDECGIESETITARMVLND